MSKVKVEIKKEVAPVFKQFLREREAFTNSLKESGKAIASAALSPKVQQ